ncbi:MAG: TetR/AcrR family transcriptional regulator [Acidobacteriota bacterium]|nr:TetR/AcrR family transcriptional regulator [Acidobacteriota bacterium]
MTRGPDKQFDRDEVLGRAMEVFWQHGYQGTGMTTLLEHMGIGRQSLYDTFGDKRTLFIESLSHYVSNNLSEVVQILRSPGSPMGNIRRVLDRLEEMTGQPHPGCLVGNSLAEFGLEDPALAEVLHRYIEKVEDEFCATLTRAKEEGELKSTVSPRDLARLMIAVGQGTMLLTKVKPDPELARSVKIATLRLLGQS